MPAPLCGHLRVFGTRPSEPVNVQFVNPGSRPPPPVPGRFNLDVVITQPGAQFSHYPLPKGYQGLILLSADGQTVELLHGNIGLRDTGPGGIAMIGGTGQDTMIGAADDTITAGPHADSIVGGLADTINSGNGDTIQASAGDLIHRTYSNTTGSYTIFARGGGERIVEGFGLQPDTVTGFVTGPAHDIIEFSGETARTIAEVIASAQTRSGNTTITLPDGGQITFVGITSITPSFFK